MHDSSTCPHCRGLPGGGSMSDEAFRDLLAVCRDALADKQARFQERIAGASRWSYDLASCSLTIGDEHFAMTPIGTYSPAQQTWLWAWANPDFPPPAREASHWIQELYDATGFQVFRDPGIQSSEADAHDFAALAVYQLGAIGIFRPPSDGPTLFLAVHEL